MDKISIQHKEWQGPKTALAIGIIALGIWVIWDLGDLFFGTPFVILALYLISHSKGIEIDPDNRRLRHFTSYFGFNTGKWVDMDQYKFLTIMRIHSTLQKVGINLAVERKFHGKIEYDLYFLTENHGQKLHLQRFNSYEKARILGYDISEQTGLDLVKYRAKKSKADTST